MLAGNRGSALLETGLASKLRAPEDISASSSAGGCAGRVRSPGTSSRLDFERLGEWLAGC